jgi:hypothetical protein
MKVGLTEREGHQKRKREIKFTYILFVLFFLHFIDSILMFGLFFLNSKILSYEFIKYFIFKLVWK